MKEFGIGLLGFGCVGAGVVRGLRENGAVLSARLGARPVIRRIADLDIETDRGVAVDPAQLTTNAAAVVDDPAVDIVIELIGGTGVARALVRRALEQGKPVVTANKALLAEHGAEIFGLARERRADLYFGASVGGGIPIIRALREGLIANRIDSIYAILNGTCNYILTHMEKDQRPFDEVLSEAKTLGYAETDPTLDIDGIDTAHKAVILASLAYGCSIPMHEVHVEGIRGLAATDVIYARDLGYRIKLLAVIRRETEAVELRVHPTLVPLDGVLASVGDVYNAALINGNLTGTTLYYGRGAGSDPTAATVLADVADVVRNLCANAPHRVPAIPGDGAPVMLRAMGEVVTRYYLRLKLADQPGVLARVAGVLGEEGIGLASVLQKETHCGGEATVVAVTHEAREARMDSALQRLRAMDVVKEEPVRLRIETAHD